MNWQKQRCLLTGATGGIGQAIAKALAEQGVSLILQGRNESKLNELCDQLPGNHYIVVADLNLPEDRQELVRKTHILGGITMLVNNAGVGHLSLLEESGSQLVEQVISTNLVAPMTLTQSLLPMLHQNHETYIVNIGSAFGSIGFAGQSIYCASKFGLRGFTEALHRELSDTQIKVFYLAPRATATAINSDSAVTMNKQLGNAMDTPKFVAQHLIKQLNRRKHRLHVGFPERFFAKLNGLFPSLVDNALAKKLTIIKRHTHHSIGGSKL